MAEVEPYQLAKGSSKSSFRFVSKGIKGEIEKMIVLTPFRATNIHDLAMGDVDENGDQNDMVFSNNGDFGKVLSTIVAAIFIFI